MVRNSSWIKLFLVLVMVMLSAVSMAYVEPIFAPNKEINDEEEQSTVRIERSPNGSSRLTGAGSKIRMYVKEKYLQIFTDGAVNATDDESSKYNILQRTSMNPGQVKIQGVATCMFLCMDVCGLLYSTKDFHDECVFNESLEKDYYNVYFSSKYSGHDRTFYLAITKNGQPRKVEIKGKDGSLGKWSSNAAVLPQPVDHQTILDLENHMLKSSLAKNRHLRHHQLCPPPYHTKLTRNKNCRKEEKKSKRKKVAGEKDDDEGKARKYEENDDTSTTNKRNRRRRKRPKLNEETATVSAEADAADEENNN